jgi:poly-gamma-glutamate capsule biosynthesis protein CapA/YwtB (metallophosphatase superfamily)
MTDFKSIPVTILVSLMVLFSWGSVFAKAEKNAQQTLTVAAVGDTMVGSIFPSREVMPPEDGKRVFERVKHLWVGADIVFANFEGAVSSDPVLARALGEHSYRFLIPPESLAIYQSAGFNVLNIANNHAMDAGLPGRIATVQELNKIGIAHIGSRNHPTAVFTTAQGIKVGLVGAAPHMDCFPLDAEQVGKKVKELKEKEQCSLVIVSMHAGAEGSKAIHVTKKKEIFLGADRGNVYQFAHKVVDAGADLVIGHGPHVPRGMEVYKGRLIAYSLGNFATHGSFNVKGVNGLGLVLVATLSNNGALQKLKIHSTKQDKISSAWSMGIAVEPDSEEGARKLIERLSREDLQANIAKWYGD